jgi:hypothetical protein
MENKRCKLGLVLMTLVLLLVLALGPAAPGVFALEMGPQVGVAGLSGPAAPCAIYVGGGSGTGGG